MKLPTLRVGGVSFRSLHYKAFQGVIGPKTRKSGGYGCFRLIFSGVSDIIDIDMLILLLFLCKEDRTSCAVGVESNGNQSSYL